MARIEEVIRLSDHFGIPSEAITSTGAIDPILNYDSKYFIDPLLVPHSKVPEVSGAGAQLLRDHFTILFDLVSRSQAKGDVAWRGAGKLLSGREVSSISLGYGSTSTHGSSLSRELAARLLDTADQIIRLGIDKPDLFIALPLIEEGVGPDTISDMVAGAILPALAEYSERVMMSVEGLPLRGFWLGTPRKEYRLLKHPYQDGPVILVPLDIVRELPIASSWDEIGDACKITTELRERFNELIAVILREASSDSSEVSAKKLAHEAVTSSDLAASKLIDLIESVRENVEELVRRAVPDEVVIGELKSDPLLQQTKREGWKPAETAEDAIQLVREIVADYNFLIEERRLSELLFKEPGQPRHERFAQMLFFAVAYLRCKVYNLDVSPEADTGNGPVDFKFSKGFNVRVLVEIKLSTNSQAVHGVERQLPKYSAAEETLHGIFLFVDVGSAGKKWQRINDLVQAHKPEGVVEAHYVDGKFRPSASNI